MLLGEHGSVQKESIMFDIYKDDFITLLNLAALQRLPRLIEGTL